MKIVGNIVGVLVNEFRYVTKGAKYVAHSEPISMIIKGAKHTVQSEPVATIKKGAKYLKSSIFGLATKNDGSVVTYTAKNFSSAPAGTTPMFLRSATERCNLAADYLLQRHPADFVSPREVVEHLGKLKQELSSMPLASIRAKELQAEIVQSKKVLAILSN